MSLIAQAAQYKDLLQQIIERAKVMQYRATIGVNQHLIRFYWSIGENIVRLQANAHYGDSLLYRLSEDLQQVFPNVKGFSYRNLHYMKNMYEVFSAQAINLPQPVADFENTSQNEVLDYVSLIPWGHIRYILDKRYSPEKSFYYVVKTIEGGWSRNVLLNVMAADLYEAEGKAIHNFPQTLPTIESDYADEILKNPYHLDFLNLMDDYKEKELQRGLEENISRFLIELGEGFAYVGRQVKLDIAGDEFYCDLLFYHLRLRRYIVVELKAGKFEPEFVSKLNLYCTAVDHLYKTDLDGETIGLLICKEQNDLVAQWTVEKSQQPIAITRYQLNKLLPKE